MVFGLRSSVLGLTICAACAAAPSHPTKPSDVVRRDVEAAETAERARKHDVARLKYQQAVADAKDPASQHFARREFAETLATWGEVAEAIAQLEGAVAADDRDPAAWHDLGFLRFQQGNTAGAVVALERSKQLAPGDPRPYKTLAVIHWKLHEFAAAKAEYTAMLGLDLPENLRAKVKWAIAELSKENP